MSKYIPGNHKHLTAADRLYIERQLNAGSSFKDIARYLCKDPSTISKEIRAHRLSDFYPMLYDVYVPDSSGRRHHE
ncbi:helix-turn-helix domain-containing protein [Lachnospiraceae bacterium MD335]|nr:helix-turn-helix domain-containing protein [Lachnospiraceae bacterium MD335]